jgi:uncharacterized SAM-binding protein YcdF (DUF218 family)
MDLELTLKEKFIILLNNEYLKQSDVIVLLEGDGLNRIPKVVELFKSGYANKIIVSGGLDNKKEGCFHAEVLASELIKKEVPEDSIILEKKSLNTREQAVEVMKIMKQYNWDSLILVASHYHQYRAFLTFLKVILEDDLNFKMYNAPALDIKWFSESEWGKRIDLLDLEFNKIDEYSKLNHIASYNEALKYFKWKETST